MNQIAQQGKDMLEIVEKYEVPQEYHAALWAAYEAGADLGFFKAIGRIDLLATPPTIDTLGPSDAPKNATSEEANKI